MSPKTVEEGEYWNEAKAPLARYYQRDVYRYAAKLIKKHGLESALDVGCGPGYKLMEIIHPVAKKVLGIDRDDAVRFASKRFGAEYFLADDVEQPRFEPAQTFDLIICSDVIEHMRDPDLLLSYIKRYSHSGTWVVFSTPERDIAWGNDNMESPNQDHVREWNKDEFVTYLKESGFPVVETKVLESMAFHISRLYLSRKRQLGRRTRHCLMAVCKMS